MSTSLVVSGQGGCAGAFNSHPSFWGPSISENLAPVYWFLLSWPLWSQTPASVASCSPGGM